MWRCCDRASTSASLRTTPWQAVAVAGTVSVAASVAVTVAETAGETPALQPVGKAVTVAEAVRPLGTTKVQKSQCQKVKKLPTNPSHDFPQHIEYRREGDVLHARIEGAENGESKSVEWSWTLATALDR